MTTELGTDSQTLTNSARPLHLHTLESLCADLISGSAIEIENGQFRLSSPDARSILNWYSKRPNRWAARMSEQDADAIIACVGTTPPKLPPLGTASEPTKKRLRLKKIRAHRFGGIHAYGTSAVPPDDFIFEPATSITLFEGWNGTGKTSILNAIIWCLTGEILRPQRPPSSGNDEFDCTVERDVTDGVAAVTMHNITPVTPLPNPAIFMPALDQKIPLDTWVELTFVDESGVELNPIRRTQTRTPTGKLNETAPDLASLGCDPIAFKLSTTMPALLQHIQVGSASDLGRAVSELTGLAALLTLQGHAGRARGYIEKTSVKKSETTIDQLDGRFREATSDLERKFVNFPAMKPPYALPIPSSDLRLEQKLLDITAHFTQEKAAALHGAQTILGSTFDPEAEISRNDLVENASPARASLQRIGQLQSAARLGGLTKLTDLEKQEARELLASIEAEAQIMAALLSEPLLSRRKQLYAQVASWMKSSNTTDTSHCHVCDRPLGEQIDPVTGKLIQVHLDEARLDNPELLAQSIEAWAKHTLSQLGEKLPVALRTERDAVQPTNPADLIKSAICSELFDEGPFQGVLAALKPETIKVYDTAATSLPGFVEPVFTNFPESIKESTISLETAMHGVRRAIEFSDWGVAAKDSVQTLFSAVIGKAAAEGSKVDVTVDAGSPLLEKLVSLQAIVDGSSPISEALILCKRLTDALSARRKAETRIATCKKAAKALQEFESLGDLAGMQITSLQKSLDKSARSWRDQIYHDPNTSGHKLKRTAMSADGVLDFLVGSDKIAAPAQHVSNASALRASLIGFFVAFREHVLKTRGGLDLLLLDDPQELLDQHNREKMGAAIINLAGRKSQIFVTSYDKQFAQIIVEEGKAGKKVSHYSVHAVNAQRDLVELAPSRQNVDEMRTAFERELDDHQAAANYANATRIFLETRLRDLFDDPVYPAYSAAASKPGFGDHLDHLRSLVANPPNDLFRHQLVSGFASNPALLSSHDCYRVLNDSHHNQSAVSYDRVKSVSAHLRNLARTVELMHQAFRDWRWQHKLPETIANDNLQAPTAIQPTSFQLAICPNLAAFTGGELTIPSQENVEDIFDSDWFSGKSLFYIRSRNLGLAIPSGSIAIVEAMQGDGRDHNLVIARKKGETLARRLFCQKDVNGYALAAETPDPRNCPPTKLVRSDEYAIHRIVGCLFVDSPPPASSREAVEIQNNEILSAIQVVYRVDKDSAVPMALPRQLLLGGKAILGSEFGQHEGKIAAIALKDGSHVLKRIGAVLSSQYPYVRHFETIGGLGESIVLQSEEVEGSIFDIPVIEQARLGVGVIYEL